MRVVVFETHRYDRQAFDQGNARRANPHDLVYLASIDAFARAQRLAYEVRI